ncbi:MAG: serine/threonine-protein phosphatase [Ruminococcaceae bacterium]|nr:serine/threonine-protein phosphatase [Oscillospiraceae bacterium]
MKCLIDFYSDVGGRGNNEDALFADFSENGILLMVADGLGGHDSGEVASALCIDCIKKDFYAGGEFDPARAVSIANFEIKRKQQETGRKMKTTVTIAWIRAKDTVLCHVGDSRIYAFKDNGIAYMSTDHSASQMAVAAGEITFDQIRTHCDRNILVRALGGSDEAKADIRVISNDSYDSLLLCSDGLWEYVLENEMIGAKLESASPGQWIEKMRAIHKTRIPANNDNNTAVALMKQ